MKTKELNNKYFETDEIRLRAEQLKSIGNTITSNAIIHMGIPLTDAVKEHSLEMDMTIAYATKLYLETIRKGINRIKFE